MSDKNIPITNQNDVSDAEDLQNTNEEDFEDFLSIDLSTLFESDSQNVSENLEDLYNQNDSNSKDKEEDSEKETEVTQTIKHKSDSFDEALEASYTEIDQAFLYYLNDFNENTSRANNQKILLKSHFFYAILLIMLLLCVFPYIMVFCFHKLITETTITILSLSSLAEVVSSIIVLPKIIAKYLFNKNEEAAKIKLIKNMQSYNTRKRE